MAELKSIRELMSDEARDHEFGAHDFGVTVIVIWRDRAGFGALPRIAAQGRNGIPGRGTGRRLVAAFIDR